MTIEIQRPETEALIQQRLQAGAFANVEDALLDALRCAPAPESKAAPPPAENGLRALFDSIRGLADDVDYTRSPSTGRPVDL